MSSRTTRLPSRARASATAGQAADDDVEDGQNAVDDGIENGGDGVHDGHESATDGLEDGFDLPMVSARIEEQRQS